MGEIVVRDSGHREQGTTMPIHGTKRTVATVNRSYRGAVPPLLRAPILADCDRRVRKATMCS